MSFNYLRHYVIPLFVFDKTTPDLNFMDFTRKKEKKSDFYYGKRNKKKYIG